MNMLKYLMPVVFGATCTQAFASCSLSADAGLASESEILKVMCGDAKSNCRYGSASVKHLTQRLSDFETHELTPFDVTQSQDVRHLPGAFLKLLDDVILPDMTRRTVFLVCASRQLFIMDRGVVFDQVQWFGPFDSANFIGGK